MTHWAITLYERYVQLYGEPIERPILPSPMNDGEPVTSDGGDTADSPAVVPPSSR